MQLLKKNIFYIAFFIAVGVILFLFYAEIQKNKEVQPSNEQNELSIYKSIIQESLLLQQLSKEIELKGMNDSVITVDKTSKECYLNQLPLSNKVILYTDADMCDVCVEKTLKHLPNIIELFGEDNVFLLVSGIRKKMLFQSEKYKDFKHLYWVEKGVLRSVTETPVIGYIDKDRNLRFVYCTSKIIGNDFSESYYPFLQELKAQLYETN